MIELTTKLAFSGLRRRRLQSALTVTVVAVSAAALTVALAIGTVADRPFERTFAATNGAHVTATALPGGAPLDPVERVAGVIGSTGVQPMVFTDFERAGKRYGLRLIGVGDVAPRISKPLVVSGRWPGSGEVLLERSFADFNGLREGAHLMTPGGRLVVSGVAVSGTVEAYPLSQPGLGFATVPTLSSISPDSETWGQIVGLRISDPEAAHAVGAAAALVLGSPAGIDTWLDRRDAAGAQLRTVTVIVSLYGVLLLLASCAILATLVGGRVLARSAEIGLLKATGLTPAQVSRVLVTEQMALAVVGVACGLGAGYLATPLFTRGSAALLETTRLPAFDTGRGLLVAAIVLSLVAVFTFLPGWRAAGRSTAAIVTQGRAVGRRSSLLARLADRVRAPIPVSIGARGTFVHRGRTSLTALSIALTVAAAVATLGMEASFGATASPAVAPLVEGGPAPSLDPVDGDAAEARRLRPVVYSLDAILLVVGLVNLLATLLLTTLERGRDLGVLEAVGLTPRQVTATLVSEQALVAAVAGVVGIPLGLGLFRLGVGIAGSADEFAYPSWWSVILVVPAITLLAAAFAAPLARRAAAIPVGKALRFE